MKTKVVVFGTGKGAIKALSTFDNSVEIVCFLDNNSERQGTTFEGKNVFSPTELARMDYDIVLVCSVAYDAISKQLIEMGIPTEKIKRKDYFHYKRFVEEYEKPEYKNDNEVQEALEYVKKNGLGIFNYEFSEKYHNLSIDVKYDDEHGFRYVMYNGKRMYLSKRFDTDESVEFYIKNLLMEQDDKSPHKYFSNGYYVKNGDVVIDAGVAEGNFSLDIVDKVSKLFLVEADSEWAEALKLTFAPYAGKVEIIEAFLCDKDKEDHFITIDSIAAGAHIDFIKLDIEGAEVSALMGADKTLSDRDISVEVCAYHKPSDFNDISAILSKYDFELSHTDGYMCFNIDENYQTNKLKPLVRGLIQGRKV